MLASSDRMPGAPPDDGGHCGRVAPAPRAVPAPRVGTASRKLAAARLPPTSPAARAGGRVTYSLASRKAPTLLPHSRPSVIAMPSEQPGMGVTYS